MVIGRNGPRGHRVVYQRPMNELECEHAAVQRHVMAAYRVLVTSYRLSNVLRVRQVTLLFYIHWTIEY